MTAAIYPLTLAKLWAGTINASGGTVKVVALDGTYVYDPTHEFASSLTGQLGTAATVGGKAFTDGVFTATNPTITGTIAGDHVQALAYYIDTGVAATSPLLVFTDEDVGGAPIDYTSDGANITIFLEAGNEVASV